MSDACREIPKLKPLLSCSWEWRFTAGLRRGKGRCWEQREESTIWKFLPLMKGRNTLCLENLTRTDGLCLWPRSLHSDICGILWTVEVHLSSRLSSATGLTTRPQSRADTSTKVATRRPIRSDLQSLAAPAILSALEHRIHLLTGLAIKAETEKRRRCLGEDTMKWIWKLWRSILRS